MSRRERGGPDSGVSATKRPAARLKRRPAVPSENQQSGGRTVMLSELRPGDRIAVWPYERSAALGPATATVPRGDNPPAAAVETDYIEVTRPAS